MATVSTSMADDSGRERDGRGHFIPAVTAAEIADYLAEHRGASTGELAEAFDVSTDTVRRRCSELVEQGEVRTRDAGRTTFWQPIEE